MDCPAVAYPPPERVWTYNDVEIFPKLSNAKDVSFF